MSDQIESRIQALVAAEVEKQLGRERVILKDAGNLALKIIVGAFGLLFAIFTVFGITTWKDIKTETAALVKTRIEELIQKSDSETGVRQTLNDLVNKAIVSSELIILKGEANKFELPKYEWDCLRSWIKNENLDLQQFTDALTILNAQNSDRKKMTPMVSYQTC